MEKEKKDIKPKVEEKFGMRFTVNEELSKYTGPEFEPPKLAEIKRKFSKGITIHK